MVRSVRTFSCRGGVLPPGFFFCPTVYLQIQKYRPIAARLQSRGVLWSGDIFMKFGFYGRSKQCVYHGKHKGDQLNEQDRKTD